MSRHDKHRSKPQKRLTVFGGGTVAAAVATVNVAAAEQASPAAAAPKAVDGFRVGRNGALTEVTTVTGLPAFAESGMEGIAAV
ncbi:hypothetical protein [Streptomyces zaehneri]|uniref:hypothetical protein n=1 Tax=Streptomyces zaehneri TaxID=3051180 RepID=UPI0028D0BE10|nr:hypothetical protein [Streptomyces sp. DSM 40713]